MSDYQHIEVPTAVETVNLVEEAVGSSSMVVLSGESGVGRREPVRTVAANWEEASRRQKVVLFDCMATAKPIELIQELLEEIGANPGGECSTRQATRRLAREIKERHIGLLCLAGVEALSRPCVEHIPRIFEQIRQEHRMGLVMTASPNSCDLRPVESHGLCQASVRIPELETLEMLGAMQVWDDRYQPLLERACEEKPQGIRCADIIFRDCQGNFERMIGFHNCVMRLHPKGPLTENRLTDAARARKSSLPQCGIDRQLRLL